LAIAKLVHDKISNVPSVIHVPLSAEVSERNWTAFLKRDLGSGLAFSIGSLSYKRPSSFDQRLA